MHDGLRSPLSESELRKRLHPRLGWCRVSKRNAPHGKVAHAGRFSAIQRVRRASEVSEHLHPALLNADGLGGDRVGNVFAAAPQHADAVGETCGFGVGQRAVFGRGVRRQH